MAEPIRTIPHESNSGNRPLAADGAREIEGIAPGGRAFIFASFCVFVFIVSCKFVLWCRGDTSNLAFINTFANLHLGGIKADWIMFFFVTLHTVRLQMGITFALYDESWQNALYKIESEEKRKKVMKNDRAFWVWIIMLVGVFSYSLSVANFWVVWGNLFLQVAAIKWWWWTNSDRAKFNREKWENFFIKWGDRCFLLLVILSLGVILLVEKQLGPDSWRENMTEYFTSVAIGVVSLQMIILAAEIKFSYWTSLGKAFREFMKVVTAREID